MTTTLFVSPHFDDVGWSCVAHVAEARRTGRVLVATVFGHGQQPRREEDGRAMSLLGAEPVALPFLDAPERLGIEASLGALLLDRHVREADDAATVAAALLDLVAREGVDHLVLPLGVGGHVDHRVVHATHIAMPSSLSVSFYEDQPYAGIRGALAARFAEIGAVAEEAPERASPAEIEASARLVLAGVVSAADEPALKAFIARLVAPPREVAAADRLLLWPHALVTDTALSERVLRCYASQLTAWFPRTTEVSDFIRARANETLWRRSV